MPQEQTTASDWFVPHSLGMSHTTVGSHHLAGPAGGGGASADAHEDIRCTHFWICVGPNERVTFSSLSSTQRGLRKVPVTVAVQSSVLKAAALRVPINGV